MQPIFLEPVFQSKIWGGERLHSVFGFDLPSKQIGEDWAISAHPHGVSVVQNGEFKGKKLNELWEQHQELFNHSKVAKFPLLIKILDAEADLSVQVHPDDAYALEHENERGKTECWYIIDAEPGAEIIYGHTAKTREELKDMVAAKEWDKLFRRVPVKKGDFYFVPSGTIHAIGKGILILETQQSSDTTYRLYDYDRRDNEGNLRELHLKQSIDVTTVPAIDPKNNFEVEKYGSSTVTKLVSSVFFSVYKWEVMTDLTIRLTADYTLATVVEGSGKLTVGDHTYPLAAGSSFILPYGIKTVEITGNLTLITSNSEE